MLKKPGVCVIEFIPKALRVTCISPRTEPVRHRVIPFDDADEPGAAAELKDFIGNDLNRSRTIVLFPRSYCVMNIFHFPSSEPAEVRDMTALQFARSTPHKREDLVVDARIIERRTADRSTVAGMMTTTGMLAPGLAILERAGLKPDTVTANTQRLAAIFKAAGIPGAREEGLALGLDLDGTLLFGLFRNGKLIFTNEEDPGTSVEKASLGFQDRCRKEFPELRVQKCVIFAGPGRAGPFLQMPGVTVELREIASLAGTAQELAVFNLSPVAYLDFLLARDSDEMAFDLGPAQIKVEQQRGKARAAAVHFFIIVAIFLAGICVRVALEWHQRTAIVDSFKSALEQSSSRIKEIEKKARLVARIERQISERARIYLLLEKLSWALPPAARINEAFFQDGILELQGEADGLAAARVLLTALASTNGFREARLVNVDKHSTESAETVSFRMKVKVE